MFDAVTMQMNMGRSGATPLQTTPIDSQPFGVHFLQRNGLEERGSIRYNGGRIAFNRSNVEGEARVKVVSMRTVLVADDGRLRAGYRVTLFFLLWGYGPAIVHNLLESTVLALFTVDRAWLQSIFLNCVRLFTILIAGWWVARYIDRRPFTDYGFHFSAGWWLDFCFGLLLGAALMGVVFLVQWQAGWVTVTDTWRRDPPWLAFGVAFLAPLALHLVVSIAEELLTRGNQILNLTEGAGRLGYVPAVMTAWLVSSMIFGALHVFNPHVTLVSIVNLTLMGFMFGLGYVLTGELGLPIGLHLTWNLVQGNVYGFPVSGKTPFATTVIAIEQGGPDVWTGGAFGPEGGLLGILATVIGMFIIIGWVRWRYGDLSLRRLRVMCTAQHTLQEGKA
jgi:membrane protease YdiL (CAAX protease family)